MGILDFFSEIPPILKLEVGFFSDRNFFSNIYQNGAHLFTLSYSQKSFSDLAENLLRSSLE